MRRPTALRIVLWFLSSLLFAGQAAAQPMPLRVAVTTAAENAPFFSAVEQGQF